MLSNLVVIYDHSILMLHKIIEHYEALKDECVQSGVEAATKNEVRINTRLMRVYTNSCLVQDKFEMHLI